MKTRITLIPLLGLLAILIVSCSDNQMIGAEVYPEKKVKLNTINLISDKSDGILANEKSISDFPAPYDHIIPSKFNVYFVNPNDPGDYIEFNDVEEGSRTFTVKAKEYRVVVTNADVTERRLLDKYSHKLYLYGEATINFMKVSEGTVTVDNDYTSVQVVNNDAVVSVPTIQGFAFDDVGQYYNVYTRARESQEVIFTDYRANVQRINEIFEANQVYRYMLLQEGDLGITVDTDIFTEINDTRL